MARDPAETGVPAPVLVRRATPTIYSRTYSLPGKTVYYTPSGGRVIHPPSLVVTQLTPGLSGELYRRLTIWGERLLKIAEYVDDPHSAEKRDLTEEQIGKEIGLDGPIEITKQGKLLGQLAIKVLHVLVLLVLAGWHVSWKVVINTGRLH